MAGGRNIPRRPVQAERRGDLAMREGCATIDTRQLRLARPPDLKPGPRAPAMT